MTVSLYALTEDALRLEAQITDAAERLFSDDPGEVNDARDELEGLLLQDIANRDALFSKADAWCWVIDRMRSVIADRKAHAKRLQDLARYDEERADALEQKLIGLLIKAQPDATSFELPGHKLTSRKVTSVDAPLTTYEVDPEFVRIKEIRELDKEAIKAALKAGREVPGARLVERRSWTIR